VARRILADWRGYLPRFKKIMPVDYRRALQQMQANQSRPPQPSTRLGRQVQGVVEHG
jgi:glutamate synthase (NADPH/NADH) large chain